MKSVNRTTFLGHVVAEPELRKTKSGKSVATFSVATNNEWFDSDGALQSSVDFHRIVAWEGLAELCGKYLHKGSPVYLEGRLTNRSYEGKDKIRRYVTEVVLTSLHLLRWESKASSVRTEELVAA